MDSRECHFKYLKWTNHVYVIQRCTTTLNNISKYNDLKNVEENAQEMDF